MRIAGLKRFARTHNSHHVITCRVLWEGLLLIKSSGPATYPKALVPLRQRIRQPEQISDPSLPYRYLTAPGSESEVYVNVLKRAAEWSTEIRKDESSGGGSCIAVTWSD
jgi:hypothetical protein